MIKTGFIITWLQFPMTSEWMRTVMFMIKQRGDYPSQVIVYDSDTSKTKIRGTTDNDGYAIDIVGNRK